MNTNNFKSLLTLVGQRSAGSLVYSLIAVWTIPAKNIVDSIYLLAIFEFIFGMVLPTLRTSTLAGKISDEEAGIFSIAVSIFATIITIIFWKNNLSSYLLIAILFIFPFLIRKSIATERLNTAKSLSIDARSALIGAATASLLLYFFTTINKSNSLASPLLRGFSIVIFQIYLLRKTIYPHLKIKGNFNASMLLKVSSGFDYLFTISFFKAKFLAYLTGEIGEKLIKSIIICYDPIAAFMGYFLRTKFKASNFEPIRYFKQTARLFMSLTLLSLFGSIFSLFSYGIFKNYLLGASAISILLTTAGLTSHLLLVNFKTRASIILSITLLIFGISIGLSVEYASIFLATILGYFLLHLKKFK